jgi:predicted dehydrogenase
MTGKRKVRVAVVGLVFGRIWVPAYKGHPDVEYVGVCDIDRDRLEAVADQYDIDRRYTDLKSILESDEYDAVHLLTPIPLHVEQTLAVLMSGKHCACAIPMALRIEDLYKIIDAQRESKKNYMLMETEIYSPTFLYVKKLYDEGRLGQLQFLRGVHYQNMEGWPDYWKGLPPMYYCYHGLGPILYLAQKRATTVNCLGSGRLASDLQAHYGNPFPVESALFQLEDSDVTCEVTCCFFKMVRDFLSDRFYIYGDKMGFESPQTRRDDPVIFEADTEPLKEGQRGRGVETRRITIPNLADLVSEDLADYVRESEIVRGIPLVHEFIRSIVEERPPAIDVVTGANWTAAGICAHESAMQNGEAVTIPGFD